MNVEFWLELAILVMRIVSAGLADASARFCP